MHIISIVDLYNCENISSIFFRLSNYWRRKRGPGVMSPNEIVGEVFRAPNIKVVGQLILATFSYLFPK